MATTNPVPSNEPSDLLFNAQRLDQAVNSSAQSYVDRLGISRLTLSGAMARISAVNPRGSWVTATAYAARDLVLNSGNWYIALDAHTSGASFAGDEGAHWRVHQGVTESDISSTASATKGANLVGYSIARAYGPATVGGKLNNIVMLTDFDASPGVPAAPGAQDNTAAMVAAEAYLAALGGGILHIPYPGEWRMNWVCLSNNIHVVGPGGRGEYDENCIRPYALTSAAITIGDGSTEVRYCSVSRCHISGTDKTAGAVRTATGNAPHALLVRGGAIDFHLEQCVIYNGIRNIALVPTDEGASITGFIASRCHLRNDLAGVTTARNIYLARYEHNVDSPNLGFLTSSKWNNCRVNGPKNTDNAGDPTTAAPSGSGVAGGYVLEAAMLGNVGITVEVTDSYWDCADGAGVKLTGGSGIVCQNFQLDPGGTGRVILETDQTQMNIARYVVGNLRHGGQKFKNGVGTIIDIPNEADTFSYREVVQAPYLFGPVTLAAPNDPYGTTTGMTQDMASTAGPWLTIGGLGDGLQTVNGARVTRGHLTEEITLSTGGATTNSAANMLPDNSVIEAVTWRVTQAITTAANFSIGDPTTAARFVSASTGITLGSTGVGLAHIDQTGAAGPRQTAGNNVRITCNATPGAGKVRVTTFFRTYRAPQS